MYEYLNNKKEISVLTFKLNNVNYGIPVDLSIKEVAIFEENDFKETAEKKKSIIGTFVLRDIMIGVINIKERFEIEEDENVQKSIVVLKKYNSEKENYLGLLIDGPLDIKTISIDNIDKKENTFPEIYGMIKTTIDNKEDLMILIDGNEFFI